MHNVVRPIPPGWLEALTRSEEQLAAGRTVPVERVLRSLHDSIEQVRNKGAQ
jgi:hypothetical protein